PSLLRDPARPLLRADRLPVRRRRLRAPRLFDVAQALGRRGHRRSAAPPARRAALPVRSPARELRPDRRAARAHLPREPGQAHLRRRGAAAGRRPRRRARLARALTGVLFLTESFHPVLGGGEAHIRDLGRRLAASAVAVTVVTRRGEGAWPEREELDGIRV